VKDNTLSKDNSGRNTADAIDRTLCEYRKFVRLATQNNPNILHILFVNYQNILFINKWGHNLLKHSRLFPYKGAYHRFVAYADSQRHKMRIKPESYSKLITGLEILENTADFKVMAELKDIKPFEYEGVGKHVKLGDLNFEAGIYIKKARKLVKDRINKVTNRSELFTKYGYDVKFASNLIQLLMEGIELMKTGQIKFPLEYKDDILNIKAGKYKQEELFDWADDLIEIARDAYNNSKLPSEPRTKEIEQLIIKEVKEYILDRRNDE